MFFHGKPALKIEVVYMYFNIKILKRHTNRFHRNMPRVSYSKAWDIARKCVLGWTYLKLMHGRPRNSFKIPTDFFLQMTPSIFLFFPHHSFPREMFLDPLRLGLTSNLTYLMPVFCPSTHIFGGSIVTTWISSVHKSRAMINYIFCLRFIVRRRYELLFVYFNHIKYD